MAGTILALGALAVDPHLELLEQIDRGKEIDLNAYLEAVESDLIDQALEKASGNKSRAARLLGLNRKTFLWRLGRRRRLSEETF